MAEHWDDFDSAMHETAAGLVRAAEGLQQAILGDHQLHEASKKAREEHGDLRDTVAQLEKLVLELQADIRALRQRLNGN